MTLHCSDSDNDSAIYPRTSRPNLYTQRRECRPLASSTSLWPFRVLVSYYVNIFSRTAISANTPFLWLFFSLNGWVAAQRAADSTMMS